MVTNTQLFVLLRLSRQLNSNLTFSISPHKHTLHISERLNMLFVKGGGSHVRVLTR